MGDAGDPSLGTTSSGVLPGYQGLSYDSELILNAIPGGVYSLDLEGRATLVNDAAARLLGWSQGELIGKRLHDIVHHTRPDGARYPSEQCPVHLTLRDGEARHAEAEVFWRKDGSAVPVEYDSRPILLNGQLVGALVAFRDLSERQRAEERTRDLVREQFARAKAEFQHARSRGVLVQAPALISVTRGARHVIDTVNDRYSRAIGGRDVVGKTVREAFPEAVDYAELLDGAFEQGEACSRSEVPSAVFTGSTDERYFNFTIQPLRDDTGIVYGLLTHAVDVTEGVQAARKLAAQYRLAELLARVGLVLTRTDTLGETLQACAEAVVTHADAALVRIWTVDEGGKMLELQASAGAPDPSAAPHARVPLGRDHVGRIALERRPYLTNDLTGDPLIGEQEWADREGMTAFAGYPLTIGTESLGVLALFARHALSESVLQALAAVGHGIALGIQKKRQEEALRASEQQNRARAEELARLALALERSNRELDAFAYAASHDLRAPLRGIANLAQWIEEDLVDQVELKDDTRDMLALMRVRMHRMEALIEGLLQYSRAGRVHQKRERVDTGRLVREVVDLLSPPPGARIEIAPDLPILMSERLPLQQILLNLIGNAVKHSNRDDASVRVTAETRGGLCEFAVADNGPGIDEKFIGRIWGIFQTLESRDRVEGTGIGLALVKKIVESQGGRAWVESIPGEGATFRFQWPADRVEEDS